ncbi:hypothetical protein EGI22_00305 [Lacihabitans sp. LS3-19]|uniref:hypothetical protein n=1 Tax=Lacihabitans sp. LS3-19 TaxID=2487335 RepID=UPI0020CFCE65|nr:hypothetical protein [Lacihabitans sp. LS3-19]MCP9766327.1 hypothetical protein [Lacihabitans sp. LS3-19]
MNKYLAGYLFAGETLFNIDTNKIEKGTIEQKPIVPSQSPIVTTPITPAAKTEIIPQKSLVIVVNTISKSEKELLSKILASVKKDINNAQIIELSTSPTANISSLSSAKELISFGVAMSKLGSDLLLFPYQVQKKSETNYLIVDDLATIQANQKDEKRLLWAALKSMFNI